MLIKKFEEQVIKTPANIAVKSGSISLNYDVLNCSANRVARLILETWPKNAGNKRADTVGLLLDHGPDMIIGILATLKAGKVYVPVSVDYPEKRISYILKDSGASLILTTSRYDNRVKRLAVENNAAFLEIDKISGSISGHNLSRDAKADKAAYIMYTSGSTGRPKGVVQTHGNVLYYIRNWQRIFSITEADRFVLLSSFCHDQSLQDMYSSLLHGASLYPFDMRNRGNSFELAGFLTTEKITIWHSVSSLFSFFCTNLNGGDEFKHLRFILLGGEEVRAHEVDLFNRFFPHTGLAIIYGQTESSVNSIRLINKGESLIKANIGDPLDETVIYVIDKEGNEVNFLQAGEILVSSPYLSPGYWKNGDETLKAFDDDEELGRLYWTGDRGRLLLDGSIEFLGRKDNQVKIRGFRVEPGEIESRLLKHGSIKEAAVVARVDSNDEKYLCAYFTTPPERRNGKQDSQLGGSELREFLSLTLPGYMIPSYFVELEQMPLTQSGKIDRRAMPEPKIYGECGDVVSPRNPCQEQLAVIWCDILRLEKEKIGIDTNFFGIGGHSLKATILIARIHQAFDVKISLAKIFENPTIRALSEEISRSGKTEFTAETKAEKYSDIKNVEKRSYYGISSAQKRLFILEQQGNLKTTYNMSGAVRIEGPLKKDTLNITFRRLIERHEGFRTSFHWVKGEPVQRILDPRQIGFDIELHKIGSSDQGLAIRTRRAVHGGNEINDIIDRFIRPFNLTCAPLLRAGLIRLQENEHILLFDMHHIISDGLSMNILVREFAGLYSRQKLAPLRVRYYDFTAWESKFSGSHFMKEQEKFWLDHLKGELPNLQMPLDFRRPEKQSFSGSDVSFSISAEAAKKLHDFAKGENITLNILILSIYFLLLAKYSEQEDIIVGSLVSGRSHVDMSEIIGMFANFLPIRNRIDPAKSFLEFLDSSKQRILTAYENQGYPFEKMIDKLNYEINFSGNPIFATMLILHNEMDPALRLEIENLSFSSYPLKNSIAQLDFKLDIYMGAEGELPCLLEFNTGLFKQETIMRFISHFLILINMVIEKPEMKIADMVLFEEEEIIKLSEKRKRNAPEAKKKVRLIVSSTFTAEPIENHILWWGDRFGLDMNIEFAPYNQVFPQLLDEDSLISTNRGVNLLLIRFEDWICDLQLPAEDICDKLEDDFNRLVRIIKEKPKPAPFFIGLFPAARHISFSPQVRYYLQGITRRWEKIIAELDNVYPVDFTSLKNLYNIAEIFDPLTDREGHVPFSSEFYAAMGATTIRQIYALDYNPFKVVVLDCDNTLWQGICGEEGSEGVTVSPPYLGLQQMMIRLQDEGFLLTLCSKNNEADVWDVFEKNSGMVLKKEHLVSWRINWQPKSENIKALAEELNLGIDSFIFIDDSPVECAEVRSNCPEVLTLRLPENPGSIPLFLKHVWAFDRIKITGEDRRRTTMYRADKKRKASETESLTLTDFLSGLELKVSMNIMAAAQAPRVSQLTRRTNQFNLSAIRRREEEIVKLAAEPGVRVWVVEVSDRFGDYGLVGVVITKEKPDNLFIDTFLLSCRVLGRGVEETILTGLRKYCESLRLTKLEADYYPTPKNKPFLKFLQEKWQLQEEHGDVYTIFIYPFNETGESAEFADFYYLKEFEKKLFPENSEVNNLPAGKTTELSTADENKGERSSPSTMRWEIDVAGCSGMLHGNYLLPLQYSTGDLLLGLPTYKFNEKIVARAKYEAPFNKTEEKSVEIWREILGVEKIGVNDSFFELGGNSLKAITLISAIHKAFNVELTLNDIFEKKTIRRISEIMSAAQQNLYSGLEGVEKKIRYAVSSAQKRLFILQQVEPGGAGYNMPLAFHMMGALERGKIEQTFIELIHRHESFRTSFHMIAGEIKQQVHRYQDIQFEIEYYQVNKSLEESSIISGFIRPFDLTIAPLLRVGLITLKEDHCILMVDMHHIITDAFSYRVLIRDFVGLYNGRTLPRMRLQYKDYSEWHNSSEQREKGLKQEEYWLKHLAGTLPLLDIPTDFKRPVKQSFTGSRIRFVIGKERYSALKNIALKEGSTMHMLMIAILYVLMAKLSGREDIIVGTPIAGRRHHDLEKIIGVFINTLALRNYPTGGKTFLQFLKEVKKNSLDAYENQDYPFEDLVKKIVKKRDGSRNPLFDVMFEMQKNETSSRSEFGEPAGGLKIELYSREISATLMDLDWVGKEGEESIEFSITYCTEVFKKDTVEFMADCYVVLIDSIIDNEKNKIKELKYTTFEKKIEKNRKVEFNF